MYKAHHAVSFAIAQLSCSFHVVTTADSPA